MTKYLPAKFGDEPRLGPAMSKLTEKQRAFVLALREVPPNSLGRPDQTEAARRAGYSQTPGALRVTAHDLMHSPRIQAAIREVALDMMSSEGIGLTAMLLDIAYGKIPATAGERMKAAGMVFNRTGLIESTQHTVRVEHTIDNHDAIEKLSHFAKVLNMEPKDLLGSMGMDVVDGEFVEVSPDANNATADADSFDFVPGDVA